MRKILRRLGTAILFFVIALSLAPSLIPPFLDRIYYEGSPSGHFDGQRFFNPGSEPGPAASTPHRFMNRLVHPAAKARWPESVPVRQTVPPRRVEGEEMRVTWIGHATVLIQTQGLNILTDPVWSERTSPLSFIGPKRVRAPGVRLEDLPKIDLVLVSHNHYDHMDTSTLRHLWQRDRPLIVTSLGNDRLLRSSGIAATARDWGGSVRAGPAEVVVERVHHWSSRWGTDRNRALWSGFTIRLAGGNVFFAGDTGYGDGSWPREAARSGPVRLAILPIGAYEPRDFMRDNHVDPAEAVAVFEALRPGMALGMHWGTVQLTFEAIDAPPRRLAEIRRARGIADDRFVATEVGRTFSVPPLAPAR
ncbi:MAG TPA: MBL fold metallo-hydrolase [Allosphingosinicella sp.]|jgi:L-ascorbate metabolism protein UlaG (beta-lactamase superfamily)